MTSDNSPSVDPQPLATSQPTSQPTSQRYKEARIWTSSDALNGAKRLVDLLDSADRWTRHSLGRTVEELVSRYGDRLVLDIVAEVRRREGARGEAAGTVERWARAVQGEREEYRP